jgi:hypothetical protein
MRLSLPPSMGSDWQGQLPLVTRGKCQSSLFKLMPKEGQLPLVATNLAREAGVTH